MSVCLLCVHQESCDVRHCADCKCLHDAPYQITARCRRMSGCVNFKARSTEYVGLRESQGVPKT